MPAEQKARKIAERYIAKPAFNWKAADSVTLARAYLDTLAELQAAQERADRIKTDRDTLSRSNAELLRKLQAAQETVLRIRSHAHGLPSSPGSGWIIAECNKFLDAQRIEETSADEGLEPIETSPLTEREPDL